MANMVMPDEGKLKAIEEVFRSEDDRESFVLDLFSNNEEVDDDSTAGDFDICTFVGYEQIDIARADFDPAVIVAHVAEITTSDAPVFECTGGAPQNAYGWILRGADSDVVYFGQNFDTPRVMAPAATESLDPYTLRNKTLD